MTWKKEEPIEHIPAPLLNDVIRDNNDALEAYLNREHIFSTGGVVANQIMHKQGSARMFSQASQPGTRIDGSAFAATDLGSMWIDTDNNKIYTLTAIGPVTWTLMSTEVIALLVSQINTWTLAQTLSVSPVFTKGIVANNAYLQSRNATGDGNVDMIKVNVSNKPTLPDGSVLAAATETGDPARTIADSAFVKTGAWIPASAYNGEESVTFPNGLIMKTGTVTISGSSGTINFAVAFPNGVTSLSFGVKESTGSTDFRGVWYQDFTVALIDWYASSTSLEEFKWTAWGH